ncbi:metallophosphoesterase [Candidatus Lokiarchaeum ossiferum]|uniref:metallophosphoesterase n=1 Tax=Candidatus Lokiarchaeum ossiferum TaxID=2951803 RepID=UPI00352C23DD
MKNAEFKDYMDFPFVASPNIGYPAILVEKIEEKAINQHPKFEFKLNIVAKEEISLTQLKDQFKNQLFAVPLYEHDPQTRKLIRGYPIPITLSDIKQNLSLCIENECLQDLYQLKDDRPSFLLRHNFFGTNRCIFSATGTFQIHQDSKNTTFLQNHPFLMFDIYQTFSAQDTHKDYPIYRICYHSLVIRKKSWDNLKFIQITDLHIGKRYDEFLDILSKHKLKINFDKLPPLIQKLDLQSRFKNPNNKLRQFILWANYRASLEKLDVIFMTGDIIDYYLKNTIRSKELYKITESNWETFLNLILNDPIELREGIAAKNIVEHEELAVPFYTITGNHDVRIYPYSLHTAGLYRTFGLHLLEAQTFKDPYPRANYKALAVDKYCLRPYYQYVNPFDDYFIEFGKNRFLLMNSRGERILRMKDLLMANPASKGFSDRQYLFMKTVTSRIMQEDGKSNNFFMTHGPMLNPIIKNIVLRKFLKIFKKMKYLHPSMFKERNLKRLRTSNGRADPHLEFDYGSVSRNWKNTLALMLKYNMINLAGHTHEANEIRFSYSPQDLGRSQPFSIYYDDYTSLYPMEFILDHLPLVCQTPSLGIRKLSSSEKSGAYRNIEIVDGKIIKMEVKYLSDIEIDHQNIFLF